MKTKADSANRSAFRSYLTLGALILSGCSPKPTIEMKVAPAPLQGNGPEQVVNYSVTRVAVFEDNLAYQERRGIYETSRFVSDQSNLDGAQEPESLRVLDITDNRTGKKYLGISGIGICEVGSHQVGKSKVQDER